MIWPQPLAQVCINSNHLDQTNNNLKYGENLHKYVALLWNLKLFVE